MTGSAPESAELIAAVPATVLPCDTVRDVLRDARLHRPATLVWCSRAARRR